MKTILVYSFIFTFTWLNAFSQSKSENVSISWGNELKAAHKTTLSKLIGTDGEDLYVLFTATGAGYRGNIYIAKYDGSLNQVLYQELEVRKSVKGAEFEDIIMFNKNLYVFYSLDGKKTKINNLSFQSVDKSTLILNNDAKQVCSIKYEKKKNDGSFSFKYSEDFTKLMLYYNLPYQKGEPEQFGYQVYKDNMELLWEKEITLPYKDELFSIENNIVDNNGNVYLVGVLFKEKAVKKRYGLPNYEYKIISFTDKGENKNEVTAALKNKFITDLQINITSKGDIVCGGFYSEKNTSSIKGTFYMNINGKTGEVKTENFKEFETNFLAEFMSEKKASKGKELYEYSLDKIVIREDGGAVLVAEQFFVRVVTTTTYANGVTTYHTTYYYYYNDIIVVNVNPDGTIEWAKKIPKTQVSTNDGGFYSSYAVNISHGKLYFIFNDNPKNITIKSDKVYPYNRGSKGSVVTLVIIDADGGMTREALFSVADAETIIRPKMCKQSAPDEMIIYGQKRKIQRFARLTFK